MSVRRLFLAVGLDDDTTHALAAHLGAHLDGTLPGSVVPPENWHVTLRFLGKVTDVVMDRVLAHLDQHCTVEPFSVRFGGMGAFPRPRRATVAWLATEAPELAELAAACEEAAVAAGLMPEERPFHPHLTLARIRPPEDLSDLVAEFPRFPRSMRIADVTLYESVLQGSRSARYEVVDRIEL